MARVKVTETNIKSKLTQWGQGQNTVDELIFINDSIQVKEWINQAWNIANMIVEVQPDISGFSKLVYKEKL